MGEPNATGMNDPPGDDESAKKRSNRWQVARALLLAAVRIALRVFLDGDL